MNQRMTGLRPINGTTWLSRYRHLCLFWWTTAYLLWPTILRTIVRISDNGLVYHYQIVI
ncbi:unnamed protein product, partial [Oppiella nova]